MSERRIRPASAAKVTSSSLRHRRPSLSGACFIDGRKERGRVWGQGTGPLIMTPESVLVYSIKQSSPFGALSSGLAARN